MAIKLAAATAIAMVNAAAALSDGGAAAGKLRIYSGSQPANPDTAPAGTLLVEFTLGDPAFGAGSDGVTGATATGNAVAPVAATATGTATWFRMVDSNNNAIIDGDVTDTAGTGSLKVSSTAIIAAIDVSIVSMSFTVPKA